MKNFDIANKTHRFLSISILYSFLNISSLFFFSNYFTL
jgi:hypothetical protein